MRNNSSICACAPGFGTETGEGCMLSTKTTDGSMKRIESSCAQPFFTVLVETLARGRLTLTDKFMQHGDTSVLLHSVAVAYYSLLLARKLRLPVRAHALIRGALLHPKRALANAEKDYALTGLEKDIVKKHMFPLTLVPPLYRESMLVCLTDKGLSVYETFRRGAYPALRALLTEALSRARAQ